MAVLPIIERELRVALRKQRPASARLRVAGACGAVTLLLLLVGAATGSRTIGRTLHQLLFVAGIYLVMRAPLLAAGIFADERREQTLGLLFLSGLSAMEVFASKVISAAAIACTGLLAIFPMLALPFLTGGVSFDLFLATVFVLPTLLVFALAVSLLASVVTEDDGTARDKVTRVQHLGSLSMAGQPPNQPKYEVIACIAGRGFGVRREDMKKLLLATRGKVFTSQNLDRLVEFTRLKEFKTKQV